MFGKKGIDSVMSMLCQLDAINAIVAQEKAIVNEEQRKRMLSYSLYLKLKQCGDFKAQGCAERRPQYLYKSKEDKSSPTVAVGMVFFTSVVDARKCQKVIMLDLPGALMHSKMDELVLMKLEGPMAELLEHA
jgi:hypothetical protein